MSTNIENTRYNLNKIYCYNQCSKTLVIHWYETSRKMNGQGSKIILVRVAFTKEHINCAIIAGHEKILSLINNLHLNSRKSVEDKTNIRYLEEILRNGEIN